MEAQEEERSAMLDLVRRWRESGPPAKVFVQEQGVTPWTLYYWQSQLPPEERPSRRRRRARGITLAPVHVVPESGGHRSRSGNAAPKRRSRAGARGHVGGPAVRRAV